ncbi:hypothetical protein [Undibacterium sp.]|uniref:hypothetical protein n=1 Tax=Undibacterium sp. TaxID=1914977 RepID=UPI00374D7E0D
MTQNDHSLKALTPEIISKEMVNAENNEAYPPTLMYLLGNTINPKKPNKKSKVAKGFL